MNILGFQPLTYLVQLGTMYALACVWKSNVTFSREESQKIDYVLEIYHHCFFFNRIWESEEKYMGKTSINFSPKKLHSSQKAHGKDAQYH